MLDTRQQLPFIGKSTKFFKVGETIERFEMFDRTAKSNTPYTNLTSEGISNKKLIFQYLKIEQNLQFVASNAVQYPAAPADAAAEYAQNLWQNEADDTALRRLHAFYCHSTIKIRANETDLLIIPAIDVIGEKFFNLGRNLTTDKSREASYYNLNTPLVISKKGNEIPDINFFFEAAPGYTLAKGGEILLPGSGIEPTGAPHNVAADTGYFMSFYLFGAQDQTVGTA